MLRVLFAVPCACYGPQLGPQGGGALRAFRLVIQSFRELCFRISVKAAFWHLPEDINNVNILYVRVESEMLRSLKWDL